MLAACFTPDLVVEITDQPVRRHGVDAAIFFSDIVVPLRALGVDLDIVPGVGPVVAEPIRDASGLAQLRDLTEADVAPVLEAVRILTGPTGPLGGTPLIGFAGAPFTLASYLIEGGPSRDHARTKALMYSEPAVWNDLADRLARIAGHFLRMQVLAGASAVQLFDSWAGALPAADYEALVLPHVRTALSAIDDLSEAHGVPRTLFGVGTGELLQTMSRAGSEVMGVDFRVPLDVAATRVRPGAALQGNLDPAVVRADPAAVRARVDARARRRRSKRARAHLQPRARRAARHGSRCADPDRGTGAHPWSGAGGHHESAGPAHPLRAGMAQWSCDREENLPADGSQQRASRHPRNRHRVDTSSSSAAASPDWPRRGTSFDPTPRSRSLCSRPRRTWAASSRSAMSRGSPSTRGLSHSSPAARRPSGSPARWGWRPTWSPLCSSRPRCSAGAGSGPCPAASSWASPRTSGRWRPVTCSRWAASCGCPWIVSSRPRPWVRTCPSASSSRLASVARWSIAWWNRSSVVSTPDVPTRCRCRPPCPPSSGSCTTTARCSAAPAASPAAAWRQPEPARACPSAAWSAAWAGCRARWPPPWSAAACRSAPGRRSADLLPSRTAG